MELIKINNIENQLINEEEVIVSGLANSIQNKTENWFLN